MSHLKTAHLQALYARRREAEHNRIERTQAVNKYYDHWGKVTTRFENWSTPEYYQQAEQQLQNSKNEKDKKKRLNERQQRLAELLKREKENYELELKEKERSQRNRRYIPTRTLEKMEEQLREQQKLRRRLELEAKLYGHWRHGVDDENLVFESKTDNEVLAKLNWLDKQVNQQIKREQEEHDFKVLDLKMQEQLNLTEQLEKEKHIIREQEIREIRALRETHMQEIKEKQLETDFLKEREKTLKANIQELEKEFQLLEETFNEFKKSNDFGNSYCSNNVKIVARKRSEQFRNQIKLCMSILERTLDYTKNSDAIRELLVKLEQELNAENHLLVQFEGMYESEVKQSLKRSEEDWQTKNEKRFQEIQNLLKQERHIMSEDLEDIMKKQEELIEIRTTHLNLLESSGEKLKKLIEAEEENLARHTQLNFAEKEELKHILTKHSRQGEESENSPLYTADYYNTHNIRAAAGDYKREGKREGTDTHVGHKNCDESDNNMSPRCYNAHDHNDIKQSFNSFNNSNMDDWQNNPHPTQRNRDEMRQNAQRSMQVVTAETEANRPRFGKGHTGGGYQQSQKSQISFSDTDDNQKAVRFSKNFKHQLGEESQDFPLHSANGHQEKTISNEEMAANIDTSKRECLSVHTNCNESDNNLSPRCYDSHDHNELDQASNSFNNQNQDDWQSNPHLTHHEMDDMRQEAQSVLQVVTEETEANRPRYGRRHLANSQIHDGQSPHSNAEESDNNLSPRCYDAQDHNDIDQDSNSFNNKNMDDWQDNLHPTKREQDEMRQESQREMQVVTEQTELNRPRFGRKNMAWD